MNKKLVCYFSATGNTKEVAIKLADFVNGDLFEIEPLEKYTDEDLDWHNEESRSSLEMKNKDSRPEIKNRVDNIFQYSTVFIGFPVWWYTAPTIINTFIEENNLEDKRVYIFVTSVSSSVDSSFNDLNETYPNISFINARRFSHNFESEIIDFI